MSEILSEHIPLEFEGTPISSIMIEDPFTCSQSSTISDVVRMLAENEVTSMPVVDERKQVVGFISDGDIMRYLSECHPAITSSYSLMEAANSQTFDEKLKELVALPVLHIATERVVSIPQDATLQEACTLLAQHKLKKVPVVQNGAIVGMLSRSDVIRYAMNNALAGLGE